MSWYKAKDADVPLIPDGEYEATIVNAEHKVSRKTQIPMVELSLVVYAPDGEMKLRDFLLSGDGTWKVKMFAEALNAGDEFAAQTFDPVNYVNKNVRVRVVTKPSSDPQYGPQNNVKKYEPSQMGSAARKPTTPASDAVTFSAGKINTGHKPMTDEDIPF